jgi:hypothetical protein
MELNFNRVTYDGDLADFSEEQLRELVSEFETAQESNVADFEAATEALDEVDESVIEDFEDAREALIEDITEAEAFDEVPVSEDVLRDSEATSFADLQDWKEFVAKAGTEGSDDSDGRESEGGFDDFGRKSPTDPDGEAEGFVERELGSMQGINL